MISTQLQSLVEKAFDQPAAGAKPGETLIDKYRLKIKGRGHKKLATAIEKGIQSASDLCKITPPVCAKNLGLPRSKMPQFTSDSSRDKFVSKMKKQGIRVTRGKAKVGQLKASQEQIRASKVLGMAEAYLAGNFPRIKNAIVISKDNYIVDGHHRWAALAIVSPGETMNVIRIGIPIKTLLVMVNEAPGVVKRGFTAKSIQASLELDAESLEPLLEAA